MAPKYCLRRVLIFWCLIGGAFGQFNTDFNEILDSRMQDNYISKQPNTFVEGASATATANAYATSEGSRLSPSPQDYSRLLTNALASASASQQSGYGSSLGSGRGELIIHKPAPIIVRRPPTKVLVNHPPLIVKPAPVIFHRPPAVVVRPVIVKSKPQPVVVERPVTNPVPTPYQQPPQVPYQSYLPCPSPASSNHFLGLLAGSLLTPPYARYPSLLPPPVPYMPHPYYPPMPYQSPPFVGSPTLPSSSSAASAAAAASASGSSGSPSTSLNSASASSAASASSSSATEPSYSNLRPVEIFPSNSVDRRGNVFDERLF